MNDLQITPSILQSWIRRVVSYTDEVTYFGENSPAYAFGKATAEEVATAQAQYRALLRRQTLLGSSGDALVAVAAEYGVPKLGPTPAHVWVIVQPWSATVQDIQDGRLEVDADAAAEFAVGDSVRVTVDDGSTSETVTILAKTTGTGAHGGDELDVGLLLNTYDPVTDVIKVLLRRTLPAGTTFKSAAGVAFQSLTDVTTGDSNPALGGESLALSLADKVECEATRAGVAGNVEALSVTSLQTPDDKIKAIFNPFRGFGGADEEADFSLKFRAAHQPQAGAVETEAFLEALARQLNAKVLRAFSEDSAFVSTLGLRVLTRSGGGLSTAERDALGSGMSQRLRSGLHMDVQNVVPTAIEVTATVTLTPGAGTNRDRLVAAWRSAADKLADFLDWRRWPPGQAVDEADLLVRVKQAAGVAALVTSSFTPTADTTVSATSVPMLVRFTLTDEDSGETFGAVLATTY